MLTKAEISKFFKDRAILRDMELTLEDLKDLKPEELPDAARARMERDLKAEIAEEWARMEPAAEEMRAIAKRIPQLDRREAFRLHYLDGLSWNEVGYVYALSGQCIKKRCTRALLLLMELDAAR